MIELLSVISATAAIGIRLALPLLLVALIYGQRAWVSMPFMTRIPTTVLLGILISWSLFEIIGSKRLLSQRVLQILQLALSPICGAIMGLAITSIHFESKLNWLMAGLGGVVALVLQLVRAGWFYRLRGLPPWIGFAEDVLCILLVLAAFRSPQEGGLIALLLLWFATRSAKEWRDNHIKQRSLRIYQHEHPD